MSSRRSDSMRDRTLGPDQPASAPRAVSAQVPAMQRVPAATTPPPVPRRRTPASSVDPLQRLADPDSMQHAFDAYHRGAMPAGADDEARPGDAGALGSPDLIPTAARTLTCDLESPITVGSEPRYRLDPPGADRSSTDHHYAYMWTVRQRADDRPVWQTVTTGPEIRIVAAAPGRFRVEVVVLSDGAATDVRLSLDQDVELEPAELTAGLVGASAHFAQAMRELVTDLRGYIVEAAAATGDHGIPARLLASVLFIEVLSRPRLSRERELDDLERLLDALDRGRRELFPIGALERPLGVGQIRPATAAMVTGDIPWLDQDRGDRTPARDRLKAAYSTLPAATKRAIFTALRWPRSNIAMAARLLAALKNRPHRFPSLTRAQFAADPRAVAIVATEYVSGPTSTPAGEATPSSYGSWVRQQMRETLVQRFFPDD